MFSGLREFQGATEPSYLKDFKEWLLGFPGLTVFRFEWILESDKEFKEILRDMFSPFDTELVCEWTVSDSDSFEDFKI